MDEKPESLKTILTPPMRLFLVGEFFINLSTLYAFFLPLFMSELGASAAEIGLVYSLSEVVPLSLHIISGWLSDRFGRLRMIAWGNLVKLASFIVMLLAPSWEWMILAYTLIGIGWALGGPSFSAYIADQTVQEHRAKVYAVQHNLLNIVRLAGAPLAGWIIALAGFRSLFLAASTFFLIGSILLIYVKRVSPPEGSLSDTVEHPSFKKSFGLVIGLVLAGGLFTWIFLIDHLNDIFVGLSSSLQVLYYQDVVGVSIEQIAYLPTIGAVIALFITIPLGYWVDKKGENIGLGFAYLFLIIHIGSPLLARNFLGLIPSALVHPFMMGLAKPASQSLISKTVPEEQRGLAFGLTWTSRGVLSLPFPYFGGLLWDRFSPETPFLITVIGCLGLSLLAFWKLRIPRENTPNGSITSSLNTGQ